jgi:hypothetical protein
MGIVSSFLLVWEEIGWLGDTLLLETDSTSPWSGCIPGYEVVEAWISLNKMEGGGVLRAAWSERCRF